MHPKVSVLITTKNEEHNIALCLESVRQQDCLPGTFEVIVVDNHSTDKTIQIAAQYTNRIFTRGPERSAQRNFGVEQAQGNFILYLDADMRLSGHVISECLKKCEQENCVALYIPEEVIGRGFWIKVRNFERSFYNATCIDAVRFVHKKIYLEAGGFDESFNEGEDWDLDRRIRALGKVSIIRSCLYHDEGRFCLSQYLRKKRYYAGRLDRYVAKWGKNDPRTKKQIGFFYRYFGVFIEEGKFMRLLSHPRLTLGMYFLRFMVGVVYLGARKNREQ